MENEKQVILNDFYNIYNFAIIFQPLIYKM